MNRTKSDTLFFFDNKGDSASIRRNLESEDELTNEIGELIISSSDTSDSSESVSSLDDSYDSEEYSSSVEGSSEEDQEEIEEELPLILPNHSCVYCNVYNTLCVAKCTKCAKWFCNGQKATHSGHIINHLIKSGHKEVSLHPDSPVGDATLECYSCGCKNIFLLGYIQSKDDDVVVLLCRQPCAFNAPKESDWNVENWSPLISDRRLLPWLCQFPTTAQENRARIITNDQIQKLESAWKSGMVMATLEDINRKELDDVLEPTKLSYCDSYEFSSIMTPLITAEAKIEKDLKEAQVKKLFLFIFIYSLL